MSIDWSRFAAIVQAHQRFLLVSHIRPDCDALGSELGLAAILRSLGKDVKIVNGQETPPNLAFIDPQRQIGCLGRTVQAAELTDCEVLIVLDTSAWAQLGSMAEVVRKFQGNKVVIDHHVSEDDLGAEPFKDVQAEATGRLVVEAAAALEVPLTAEMAMPLFAALATDTGWFRFSSVTATTFRVAAQLVEAGARPAAIFNALYEQDTLARMRLRGVILSRIVAEPGGRLAYTCVRQEDFAQTGALLSDTEDVVNSVLAIAGTEVALIFVEQPSGGVKVSFRSRNGALDCRAVAERFGGGGHKEAAGASLALPLDDARRVVLDAVRAAMR